MRSARYPRSSPQKGAAGPWIPLACLCAALVPAVAHLGCRRAPTAPPDTTGAITGRLLGADGKPLPGASVVLTTDPDQGRVPLATLKTSAAGTFAIERLPLGEYRLRARAPGHVEALARIAIALPKPRQVNLTLLAAVSLAGHIQDQRGTPVPLARVLAFAVADASASIVRETQADAHGDFELSALAPGAHRLLIEAPGLGTASAGPILAPDPDVLVVLPGQIRAITGQVVHEGRPVAGARLHLGGEAVAESRTATADAQGRFAFAGLGPGNYVLRGEAGGLVSPVVKQVVLERAAALASGGAPVPVLLAAGSFVQGSVVSDDGQPVVGASVQLDLVPATGLWPPVSSDGKGQWTSPPLAAGTYRVRARCPGFVAAGITTVSVGRTAGAGSARTGSPPVVLRLMHTGQILGRVVDDAGRAVSGATVHDRLAETEELGVVWARLPLAAEAAALPPGTAVPFAVSKAGARRAITDAAGVFTLSDVPPGRVQVEVLNAASVPLRTHAVTLAPGARLDVGALRVARAIQVKGRVVEGDDQPVAGARVAAVAISGGVGSDGGGGLYAVTASDGSFSLPLPAGEHRLTARLPGRADATALLRLTGAAGAGIPAVTLRFMAPGGGLPAGELAVSGSVHDAEGRPLARARITAQSDTDGASASRGDESGAPDPSSRTARTDAGGGFRLSGLPARRLFLGVHHDRYAPFREAIDLSSPSATAATSSVKIVVPVPGRIDGEVHEKITGAPVPRFQIDARGPDGAEARFPEAAGGSKPDRGPLRFSLTRLTPGRWTLRVQASGYRPLEKVVDVASAPTPGEPSIRDLRLELDRS